MSANFIRTVTGHQIDFLEPDPAQITVEDIAHNLAMQCRFVGGVKRFYSVAEHSLNVSALCEARGEDPLWGLFHDAAEAYIGDVSSPLKAMLPDYKKIENRLMKVIAARFNLDQGLQFGAGTTPLGVKQADIACLNIEGAELTPNDWAPRENFGPTADLVRVLCLPPESAKEAFLGRYRDLLHTSIQRQGAFFDSAGCRPRNDK